MSGFFAFLLLISIVALAWGLIAPQHLAKTAKITKPVTRKHTGLTLGLSTLALFVLTGVTAPPQVKSVDSQRPIPASSVQTQKPAPVTTTKQVSETQPIAFTTVTRDDSTLPKGQSSVVQAGVNGVTTLTYSVTYTNGVETNRSLVRTEVTTPAVEQIVANGTYVKPPQPSCPNGTYVNAAGNSVCRPVASSSAPAGATAQCRDNSYSYSQSRSGTCSHHGGVASWL